METLKILKRRCFGCILVFFHISPIRSILHCLIKLMWICMQSLMDLSTQAPYPTKVLWCSEADSQLLARHFYFFTNKSPTVLLLTFQIFQIFQEMKYFFLCFSTSWKMVFYGIQIFEKLFSMLFRFWKENFYAFHLLEKVILWFSVYTLGS